MQWNNCGGLPESRMQAGGCQLNMAPIFIQSLPGEIQAEEGFSTARVTGLSITTEAQDQGSWGQVRCYFKITQITANMFSGGKYPSLEGGCNFGSQASQSEPSLGNKWVIKIGRAHV